MQYGFSESSAVEHYMDFVGSAKWNFQQEKVWDRDHL